MKNNSMTNFAFATVPTSVETDTFNIGTQAAVLDSDPYQFLDSLDQKITCSPLQVKSRLSFSHPLSLN